MRCILFFVLQILGLLLDSALHVESFTTMLSKSHRFEDSSLSKCNSMFKASRTDFTCSRRALSKFSPTMNFGGLNGFSRVLLHLSGALDILRRAQISASEDALDGIYAYAPRSTAVSAAYLKEINETSKIPGDNSQSVVSRQIALLTLQQHSLTMHILVDIHRGVPPLNPESGSVITPEAASPLPANLPEDQLPPLREAQDPDEARRAREQLTAAARAYVADNLQGVPDFRDPPGPGPNPPLSSPPSNAAKSTRHASAYPSAFAGTS